MGQIFGLSPMPAVYFLWLGATILAYMVLITILKKLYIRRYGEFL